jgi:hypothetical protein
MRLRMTEAPLGCFADALADLDQHQLTRRRGSAGCGTKLAGGGDQHSPGSRRPIGMTVPAYRAGTGPQPDPLPATARAAADDLLPGLPSGQYSWLAW